MVTKYVKHGPLNVFKPFVTRIRDYGCLKKFPKFFIKKLIQTSTGIQYIEAETTESLSKITLPIFITDLRLHIFHIYDKNINST